MIIFNDNLLENSENFIENNRGFLFGDMIFETIKIVNNKPLFFEEHYLRLMASMRICRMQIPMRFTIDFFENQIQKLIYSLVETKSYRIRINVFRNTNGNYTPKNNTVSYLIYANEIENNKYTIDDTFYEVELFKDFYVSKNLLSTLKTNNKMINICAGIFAKENNYHNCLLINEDKNITEAINGNIFMINNNSIITPPITDGCLNGIMRLQVIKAIKKIGSLHFEEKSISPFDLQKADELFITNVISGITSITKYRKKTYSNAWAKKILSEINLELV